MTNSQYIIRYSDWFRKGTNEAHFQEVIDMLLNLALFVYIGATLPLPSFVAAELPVPWWRLIILALLIFAFRRIPIIIVLGKWIPAFRTYREGTYETMLFWELIGLLYENPRFPVH